MNTMGEGSEKITAVKIYNQTYQVRSGNDPEYIKRLAEYVDAKMTEVLEQTPTVDSLKVAVLAALNLADEYFSTRQRYETLERDVGERSRKMLTILEPLIDPEE